MISRMLTLVDVSELLNVSLAQVRTLVRTGELEAFQVGGKGVWRVEESKVEEYVARMYEQTRRRRGLGELDDAEDERSRHGAGVEQG